ncbi:MAG: glycoside hydrolase family 3 N-terminal domain-containing protein [Acidimicrobiales bacterium]
MRSTPGGPARIGAICLTAMLIAACSSSGDAGDAVESTDDAIAAAPTAESTTIGSTTTTTSAPTTTAAPTVEECLEKVPIDVRLGQLLFPVITPDELDEASLIAARGRIAGVVVIGSPDASVTESIAGLQAASLVAPSIVAVDEEGGRVQRLKDLLGPTPSARETAAELTPAEARAAAAAHNEKVAALGFTMNLGPVIDLDTGVYVGNRSFGADPETVANYGEAIVDGIIDAGLTPTAKHFPGHGSGSDSHLGLPVVPDLAELRDADLLPFQRLVARGDVPIMIGHLVVPDLTGTEPATLSPAAIDGLLRGELGFDGLVMTDAFNMDAIADTRTNAEAAELALIAGADLAMLGRLDDVDDTLVRLLGAVSDDRLPLDSVNESFLRVLDHKGIDVCDLPADLAPAIRCDGVTSGGCGLSG